MHFSTFVFIFCNVYTYWLGMHSVACNKRFIFLLQWEVQRWVVPGIGSGIQRFQGWHLGSSSCLSLAVSRWLHHSKYHIYIHNRKGWERQLRAYFKETEAFLEAHRSLPILFCWLDLHPLALCSCKRSGNLGSRVDVTGFNQSWSISQSQVHYLPKQSSDSVVKE